MSITVVILTVLFFLAMGFVYCVGWDYVKKHMPEHQVHFYMIAAAARFILVALLILAYIRLAGDTQHGNIKFAMLALALYVALMIVIMRWKHNGN